VSRRILFVVHTPPDLKTAVFLCTSRIADYLRTHGHSVEILTPEDLPFDMPRLRPLFYPLLVLLRAPWRYDVVIFHSYAGWAFHCVRGMLPRWLRQLGTGMARQTRTITQFHGLEPLYHEAVERELSRRGARLTRRFRFLHLTILPRLLRMSCRHSDGVFCLNDSERAYIVQNAWSTPKRVAVVANGIEPAFCQEPIQFSGGRTLMFVGQWLPAKGIRYLTEAFMVIAAARPDAELVCVGTGAPASVVLACFDKSIRDRVRVMPRVNRDELLEALLRADVLMFPSLFEGFGGALLEAMATGRALVATRTGLAAEVLQDDLNALLVPFADVDALASAALKLLADEGWRLRLGRAAAAAARPYTWDAVNERYRAEIFRVVSAREEMEIPTEDALAR
jgi:glycosyltransferase involved in cell wall biosynthesis